VHSSSLVIVVPCVGSGILPRGGGSPAPASGGGRPAMESSVVAWAWSLGPLLEFVMATPLNKLGAAQILDPDLGFLAGLCRKAAGVSDASLHRLSHRGGEVMVSLVLWLAFVPVLQLGSTEAALGSVPTAAPCQPLFSKVVGRPLPPSSSVTASPGRQQQVFFNLQAKMPFQRPFSSGVEGSRRPTPSGFIPGGVVLVCVVSSSSGDGGAGPDCFFLYFFRVLCANCLDLFVISTFPIVLPVILSPLNECF
jgi:hypothetical protein